MQFVAQLNLADLQGDSRSRSSVLLLFLCQNQPGMCDDWDANSGGNCAMLLAEGSDTQDAPASGNTMLSSESYVTLVPYDSTIAVETDDDGYVSVVDEDDAVLGKVGGNPLWLQADETPNCECGRKMQFLALLEDRGGGGINFGGGGVGYAFLCTVCP